MATPADSVLDLSDLFAAYEARGTFVVYDVANNQWLRHDPARAAERFTPASTFKVYNSLVALQEGVISPDVDSVQFTWDGETRWNPDWNQDQTLRQSMQRSTVWVYQEIARRVGETRYAASFAREPYGNGDRSCGLDVFWLDNCLRISADEQVRFLDRLRRGETAFRPEVQAAVRDLIVLERGDGYTLYGKTGWGLPPGPNGEESIDLGWLVGWVERPEGSYVFALNLEGAGPTFNMRAARHGLLFAALARLGLRPAHADDPAPTAAPPPDADGAHTGPPLRLAPAPEAPGAPPTVAAAMPPVAPPDEWVGRDKALHFGVSFLMTLASQYVLTSKAEMEEGPALPVAAGFTLAVGLGKEVADSQRSRSPLFSFRDLAADALGIALASLIIAW